MKMRIRLNGTSTNPFHKMGLTQNPFGQLNRAEYDAHERVLRNLGAEPIKSVEDLKRRLGSGFSEEFVALCVEQFKPGEMVEFTVEFGEQ